MQMQQPNVEFWDSWINQQSNGLNQEAWRGVMCVLRWLAIRESNSIPPPGRFHHLEDDISHSALLRRLIDGKDPLPDPPPESFGQPWYELVEIGTSANVSVSEIDWGRGTHLIINQALWKVIRQENEDSCLVTHRRGGSLYRLERLKDGWRLSRVQD